MTGFEPAQTRKLKAKLKPQHIRSRQVGAITLNYIEGWHAIAEANRIFGFDGWDRETVESKCVWSRQNRAQFAAAYVTRIRIVVNAAGRKIVREGLGAGEATALTAGQAHEMAAKAAETDATKRALMTFGNAFGLSLYGGDSGGGVRNSSEKGLPAKPSRVTSQSSTPVGTQKQQKTYGPSRDATSPKADAAATDPPEWRFPTPRTRRGALQNRNGQKFDRPAAVDKSKLSIGEPQRIRDPEHLKFVAKHGCLICGRNRAQAHHLKFIQPTAMGRKVSDEFTVPLCAKHHRELHEFGDERIWWRQYGVDPLLAAANLWANSQLKRCNLSQKQTRNTSKS